MKWLLAICLLGPALASPPLAAQSPSPTSTSIAEWDWLPGKKKDHWYALTHAHCNSADAQGEALLAGGHLVTIDSKTKNTFLLKTFKSLATSPWIGLGQRLPNADYKWTSGATFKTSLFGKKQEALAKEGVANRVVLHLDDEEGGTWEARNGRETSHFGLIEIDVDPASHPLDDLPRTLKKYRAALTEARGECFRVADREAEALELERLGAELAAMQTAGVAIVTAPNLASREATSAAADDVQDWIHASISVWGRDSKHLRAAIVDLQKAHGKVLRADPTSMGLRALLTDIFCAIVDRKSDAVTRAARALNHRLALRSGLDKTSFAIVLRANEHRQLMGLPLLVLDGRLVHAAQVHATDMQTLGFFAHESPVIGRETPADRLREVGFFQESRESIYQGARGTGDPVGFWKRSPAHHRILLDPDLQLIGAGVADNISVKVLAKSAN